MLTGKYPRTLAAARAMEKDQWGLGDALLEEIGAPGEIGHNNDTGQLLTAASAYLRENGLDYAENTLRSFRDVSQLYPVARRRAGVPWSVHRAVPGPDMLDRIIAGLPASEKPLTVAKAERMVGVIFDQTKRRLEAERADAREEAETAELAARKREQDAARAAGAANSDTARRAAEREQAAARAAAEAARRRKIANQQVPSRKEVQDAVVPPPEMDIPAIALASVLIANADRATILATETMRIIELRGDELSQTSVDAFVEASLQAHEKWLETANEVRRNRTQKRGHLAVVGE